MLRRSAPWLRRPARWARLLLPWSVYALAAFEFTSYLNDRADLAPESGQWYSQHAFVALQARALLRGKLALLDHPSGAAHDWDWGRGGMHQAWGLGVPILSIPFQLVARLWGVPGFPDDLLFLLLYGATVVVLARALHRAEGGEPAALVRSTLAAGFVMLFPTYVGMVSSRFMIYEETIAIGALWSVLLLAGTLFLFDRVTPTRLVLVGAAAGFSILLRPPLAIYGLSTVIVALGLARARGVARRAVLGGVASYAGVSALYPLFNLLRFGSVFNAGYENCISGPFVNRLARWGLPFAKVPLVTASKEMFATLFLLDPVPSQVMMGAPPTAVAPYVRGERWREYYAPTFDRYIFLVWLASLVVAGAWLVRRKPWRVRVDRASDLPALIALWGALPAVVLFFFYARLGNMVTRYASDMFPAFAAAGLAVGMSVVAAVRTRAPSFTGSAELALTAVAALYFASWHGWVTHLSRPTDRAAFAGHIAEIEGHSVAVANVPDHFECGKPRGPAPIDGQLADWRGDCSYSSGVAFAMPHHPCVAFTFAPAGPSWTAPEEESLASVKATGDSDHLVRCGGPARPEGLTRTVTLCDPRPPPYLLDGMRLYSLATLDADLTPIDRLKLMRIEGVASCP